MLELVHIAANKNTVPGDVSAMVPGGIRMGKGRILFLFNFSFFFAYLFTPKFGSLIFASSMRQQGNKKLH